MDYAITLKWNRKPVLQGRSTLVTATETARSFVAGNFAGPLGRVYVESEFGVERIQREIEKYGEARGVWEDSTGRAEYSIKIAPPATSDAN